MVKVTLQFKDEAFEEEGIFGMALVVTENEDEGFSIKSSSAGSGNVGCIVRGLGQVMGQTLKKLAEESEANTYAVFTEFAEAMFDD